MDTLPYLKFMVEKSASDLFFSVGTPVHAKIQGHTAALDRRPLTSDVVRDLAYSLMTYEQVKEFESALEMNLGISRRDLGRFRVNVYRQRGEVAMVIRHIRSDVPSVEALGLPAILNDLILAKHGQIFVVGATGTGKSTTLAAMLNHRNELETGHIVTIEDPIEFVHQHKRSVVDQREVGLDTLSYHEALKNALRQAPDVIAVGEIRDVATMEHAHHFAETGHLCLATLHANNATQAVERIVNFFPMENHRLVFQNLAIHLRAIISQRLIRGTDGRYVPAVELLLNTPRVSEVIAAGAVGELRELMGNGEGYGMMTFDKSLFKLFSEGRISEDAALANADSVNDLRLRIHMGKGQHGSFTDSLGRERVLRLPDADD